MSFIEFGNIYKKYPGADRNTVDGFNLNIEEKEFIVGLSGCGKSGHKEFPGVLMKRSRKPGHKKFPRVLL